MSAKGSEELIRLAEERLEVWLESRARKGNLSLRPATDVTFMAGFLEGYIKGLGDGDGE